MRLCMIKSKRLENRQKSIQDDTEIPIKVFFHLTHLYFLPSNPTILKAFPENFSTKMKPKKSERSEIGQQEKQKQNVDIDCCVTLKPKNYLEILLSGLA